MSVHVSGLDAELNAIAAEVSAHVSGLDVPSDRVPLLGAMWSGAMVRCHCLGRE